jgi:predicted O-methyltransferase YrrM
MNKPFISGEGLLELLRDKTGIIGLEIGTNSGETTAYLLDNLPTLTMHCIDPYSNYVDWNGNVLHERESMYEKTSNRFSKYSTRCFLHRKTSDDAVTLFSENQFDFIFIDGLHTYEQVLRDCQNYYQFLKVGGLFSGHDYNVIAEVRKAVDEYSLYANKSILKTYHDVWYWYK